MSEQATDKLAVIGEENLCEVLHTFETVLSEKREERKARILNMTDDELNRYLSTTKAVATFLTADAAQSFIDRFKAAKKRKERYCGYNDFNDAAFALTSYTGRQIRNIAAGTPAGKKKQPTPPTRDEIENHKAKKELQAKTDATAAAAKHELEMKNESSSAKAAVVADKTPLPSVPVTARPTPTNPDVAAKDANDLDTAILILRALVFNVDGGKQSREMKKAVKAACEFLKLHGGLNVPPPAEKKPAGEEPAEEGDVFPTPVMHKKTHLKYGCAATDSKDAVIVENDPTCGNCKRKEISRLGMTAKNPDAVKNEASQGTPFESGYTGADDAHGETFSDNSKGTGAQTQIVTGRQFKNTQRKSAAVV